MVKMNSSILRMAVVGYEAQLRKIEEAMAEIRSQLDGRNQEVVASPAVTKPRRKMSAAGRRRIAEAQRARWANAKQQPTAPAKPKRKLSAAARAKLVANLAKARAARWGKKA